MTILNPLAMYADIAAASKFDVSTLTDYEQLLIEDSVTQMSSGGMLASAPWQERYLCAIRRIIARRVLMGTAGKKAKTPVRHECPNCLQLTLEDHEEVSHHNGDFYWVCQRAKL